MRERKTRPALQFTYSLFVAPSCSGICIDIPICELILFDLRSSRKELANFSPSL